MEKDYYKEYYNLERNHWWFVVRERILREYIRKNIWNSQCCLKILNVGAATGASSIWLGEFGQVESIEYDKFCLDFVRPLLEIEIKWGDITGLDYAENSFDLICAFDVLEHIEDDSRALKELSRVCRPGGSILLTVPAFNSVWSDHDTINHHFRRYRLKDIESLCSAHKNFSSVHFSYFNFLLFLPIAIFRRLSNFVNNFKPKREIKSDFSTNSIFSSLLKYLFLFDIMLVANRKRLPFGLSILTHIKLSRIIS